MQRTLPFGYQMINGEMAVNNTEKEVLTIIFQRYADGDGYKVIADEITKLGINYHTKTALWNKNMVARILVNEKYLGTDTYPSIIDTELYEKANQTKTQKSYSHEKISQVKGFKNLLICNECGEPIKRRMKNNNAERWYCPQSVDHVSLKVTDEIIATSLKKSIAEHTITEQPQQQLEDTSYTENLKRETENLLLQGSEHTEQIKDMIMNLAKVRYENCSSNHSHIQYKMALLKKLQAQTEYEETMLEQIIHKLKLTTEGEILIIERS